MQYFNVSYILSNNDIPPFVLGAFLSRSIFSKDNKIYTEASFKQSKYASMNLEIYKKEYLDKLNKVSFPFVWELVETTCSAFKAKLTIINDLKLEQERFFSSLYFHTVKDFSWIADNKFNDEKKFLIRGFIEPRGSVDTSRTLIAQDYYYSGDFETKKYRILTDFCNTPYNVLNLNFRDLQQQYYEGTNKRNTQFRINSRWYMKHIRYVK